jgi:hypothetical protein
MTISATDLASALDEASCHAALLATFEGRHDQDSFVACEELLHEQRREFLSALTEVGDEQDMAMLIATRYIEQKSRWIQWNLVLNYKMMLTGTFDIDLACKASVISDLLSRIEPYIDAASLARINELLNEPIVTSSRPTADR